MPVVVVPPVVVMVTPVTEVTDAPRTVVGPDHRAAAVRVIIGIIIVRVVGRAIEEAPVKVMVVGEPVAAVAGAAIAKAAAVEDRTGAKRAAMEDGAAAVEAATMKRRAAAAVKHGAPTVKTAAAVEAAAASTTVASATATAVSTTADFGRQSVGGKFRRRRSARIDQRHRLRALWNS